MSGGHFDYAYSKIGYLAEELEEEIKINDVEYDPDNDVYPQNLTSEGLHRMQSVVNLLQLAKQLAYEAEWLYSGDTGEDEFIKRYENIVKNYDWVYAKDK